MELVRITFCKTIKELRPCANLPPKVARTNVVEWRTPEDRDEKTESSCIKIPLSWSRGWRPQNDTNEGGQVQNVKMSHGEKNGPKSAQKRPRPVGPFGPAQPSFASVRAALSSVLSSWNPNRRGKLPFARDVVHSLRAAKEETIDYKIDPWGRTLERNHCQAQGRSPRGRRTPRACHGATGVEGQWRSIFIGGIHNLDGAMPSIMMG
jgi:hypothetical protein